MNKPAKTLPYKLTNVAYRQFLWRYTKNPEIIKITEFPKAGGTWLGNLIAGVTNIPFPRNRIPETGPKILHGHYCFQKGFGKTIAHVRDGRDIMVSAYYHFLFENEHYNKNAVKRTNEHLQLEDKHDIKKNLPAFIEYMFTVYPKRFAHFSWAEFVKSIVDQPQVLITRYEDLLTTPLDTLKGVIDFLDLEKVTDQHIQQVIDQYSFRKQTNRKPGEENKNSFLRKGIAGDWKNNFTPKAAEVFHHFAGKELIALNYESNPDWIQTIQ